MSSPIRLRHTIVPLIALPAGGAFQLAFAVGEGYDPGDVADWRVTLAPRYGSDRTPWTSADVSVAGQTISFSYGPDAASDDDAELTIATVTEQGMAAWSLTALDGDDLPIWRVQGHIDFVPDGGDPESGSNPATTPIPIRLEDAEPITLTIATGEAGADGAAVEMQASETHIQYRLVGSESWINVIALSELEGATGPQGIQGQQGAAGQTGATGTRGSKWFQGSSNPTAGIEGLLDGDFYFQTTAFTVWQFVAASSTWFNLATITATIADGSVTNAKLANMAAGTIKGRQAGAGTGGAEDLTASQARAAMGLATTDAPTFAGAVITQPITRSNAGFLIGSSANFAAMLGVGPFNELMVSTQLGQQPSLALGNIAFGGHVGIQCNSIGGVAWNSSATDATENTRDVRLLRDSAGCLRITGVTSTDLRDLRLRDLIATQYLRPASYTVAAANALVSPPDGALILVSNESGGSTVAQRARSAWRRIYDDAAIS